MKLITVDLSLQIVEAFEQKKRIFRFDCVTGDHDHPTDIGIFHIFRKQHPYRSVTYNVQMNYAMFFTQDGKALHQYHGVIPLGMIRTMKNNVTDRLGSHGCVRLSEDNARSLYNWADCGTTVKVTP
jgi:lipoprotein-anchoring transpeptidase ErfK/SrfK